MELPVHSGDHPRNLAKYEYEAMPREGDFWLVGNTEKTALKKAAEVADNFGTRGRLYVTHPSPGPTRRYMGQVDPDGTFYDARR